VCFIPPVGLYLESWYKSLAPFKLSRQIEIGDWTFKFEGHTVQADFDMECTHRTPSPVGTFHVKISTAS